MLFSSRRRGEESIMKRLASAEGRPELEQYADGFVAELGRLGYSPRTCGAQAALLRHLARWLAARHVPLSGLGSEVADEYIAARGRSFLRSGRALGPLLGYLRGLGVVPPGEAVAPEDPAGVLLARFGEWLSGERGLAPATVRSYLQQARSFAAACAGQLPALTPARVADLATAGAAGLLPRSAQVRAGAVRALLRFLWLEGLTAVPLAGAVGSFAAPAGADPPKGLSPGQAGELLAFVRGRPGGIRDEPMVALLLRLALRASETAALRLDDIAWRQGTVTVRGKGNRIEQVPLPCDVGGPLARYLRDGRPAAAPCRPAGDRRLCQVRHHGAALDRAALAGRGALVNTDLRAAVPVYLAARRARGYRLDGHEQLLGSFLDSLESRGETRITVRAAVAFATAPAGTSQGWHAQRLAAVRPFAGFVHGLDPAAADPVPDGLIPARTVRRIPYLYSGEDTARLMAAAGALSPAILAASMRTLIGLLASTGIRSGEAFAPDAADLDTAAQVLAVTGKYGRTRLIALHPTAAAALADYLQIRARHVADGTSALLIGQAGRRLNRNMACAVFRSLTAGCGLAPQPGCGSPRLHDFRHTVAVSTLADALRHGRDVDACIAVLATHLGHVSPAHTYWY